MSSSPLILENESDFAFVKVANTNFSVFVEIENGQPVVRINSDPDNVACVIRVVDSKQIQVEKSDLVWDANAIPLGVISMERPTFTKRLRVVK